MKVAVIAGGVGGARLSAGLAAVLPPQDLSVVVNVGDDFTHLGLKICPDLDTVMYTLAGLENRETGWGLHDDTFNMLDGLSRLGGDDWFRLGDRDLATHFRRTALLAAGLRLTEATRALCRALAVPCSVLPATDDPVPTRVLTDEGLLDFQDYFVRRRCEPSVLSLTFEGVEDARPSPEAMSALRAADAVILAPSNPFVSIEPVLALPGVREAIAARPAVAVSPIVGGSAIKGPAAKMMRELGLAVSPVAVAGRYAGLIRGFVMDEVDANLLANVQALGLRAVATQSIMRTDAGRASLASACLALIAAL